MNDLEITRNIKTKNIFEIANKIGLSHDDIVPYGNDKAKITSVNSKKKGKLILVTAISPTPLGEGKTTVSVGLADAFRKIGEKSIVVLREPSMGPVFGMKGGATGGGYSQVVPMEDINLHFTGDFHAITSANNLLCSAIDNHIYYGNKLDFDEVLFNRCLDVNDRSLRLIDLGNRNERFTITAASEIMALFCLANSLDDLKRRLGNIIVGRNSKKDYIYAKDLNVVGAMLALLKDAFNPNLVQTLEGTPALIHGGPFANIAHGCNSVVATNLGLKLADYVITEAGFGSDLGAEKFFDIKCRKSNLTPDAVVLVATIKALKFHGGVEKKDIFKKNNEALIDGLENLKKHIENMKKFVSNVVVCLNKFSGDLDEEIELVRKCCDDSRVLFSISDSYSLGGSGAIDVAEKVIAACAGNNKFQLLYQDKLSIREKIKKVAFDIYGADSIDFSSEALSQLDDIEKNGFSHFPVCIAKTQYSFSDDAKKVGVPKFFTIHVKELKIYSGAEFIVVLLDNIMTMPGLSEHPNYESIDVLDSKIVGLF